MTELKLTLKMFGWSIVAMFLGLIVICGCLSFIGAMLVGPSGVGMILGVFGFATCFFVVDPMFAAMLKTLEYEEKLVNLRLKAQNI